MARYGVDSMLPVPTHPPQICAVSLQIGATTIRTDAAGQGGGKLAAAANGGAASGPPITSPDDPRNTTLFVGGLAYAVSEEELKAAFSSCGPVLYSRIPAGKVGG